MADLDFFFDPVCPWAWITSRWVHEVAAERPLEVEWRFIGLRIINEHRDYATEFPPGYVEGHGLGLRLLRICAAAKAAHGNDATGRLYTELGIRFHSQRRRPEFLGEGARGLMAESLTAAGLPAELAAAEADEAWDAAVRADSEEALARTGRDVGTPIITFGAPDGPSFFGPVLDHVPTGADAVQLFDQVETLARFPGFAELKRSTRGRPQTAWYSPGGQQAAPAP